MKNKATLLLHSFDELISCLTDEEAGRLLKAIFDYDIRGESTEFEDRALMFLYIQIRNTLDTNKEHYEKVCDVRRKNIQKRWEKPKAEGETDGSIQMYTNEYNINIKEKENIKVKENSNENVKENESKAEGFENADTHTHKKAYGDFSNVFLTDEEYELVAKMPDGERRLQSFSAYIAATGKTYANYYAGLLNWNYYGNAPRFRQARGDVSKSKKPPGERREPTFDVSAFTKKALNLVYVPPQEDDKK